MGGNALEKYGIKTKRLSTTDFLKIANFFKNKIQNDLNVDTHIVKYYRNKKSHGDLDLLIKLDNINYIEEYININFNPTTINNVKNSNVYSFDYKNFQIDFIIIYPIDWEVSKTFYDFDPSGDLMIKSAIKMGVKYDPKGLKFKINYNNKTNTITLTKNNKKIFQFLGFDYNKFIKGFDNIEEIFEWTKESEFFDVNFYLNINSRNKKRKTYQQFLKYIKNNKIDKTYNLKKNFLLKRMDEYFPNSKIRQELNKLKQKDNEKKEIANKFNGNIIMNKYKWLRGEELGNIIKNFKSIFDNFELYILNNDSDKIMCDFDNFLNAKSFIRYEK